MRWGVGRTKTPERSQRSVSRRTVSRRAAVRGRMSSPRCSVAFSGSVISMRPTSPRPSPAVEPGPGSAPSRSLSLGTCVSMSFRRTSASTGPRIRRFVDRARGEGPLGEGATKILEAWSAGMSAAVTEFRDGCQTGSGDRALRATEQGRALLSRLGALTGIPIWTTALRRACDVLGPTDAVAIKPSGAGGGDCAVALGPGRTDVPNCMLLGVASACSHSRWKRAWTG